MITTLPFQIERHSPHFSQRCVYTHVEVDETNDILFNHKDYVMSYLLSRECAPQFTYFNIFGAYVDESKRYRCLEVELHCLARLFVFDADDRIIAIYHRDN